MKRREFFEKAGIGSAALVTLPGFSPATKDAKGSDGHQDQDHDHGHEDHHEEMRGALASATMSFGEWNVDPALDRFPNNSPRTANNHHLIPGEVEIKAGGSVRFVISGFHHILIYDDGTKPQDINIAATIAVTVPPGPALINDPIKRIYRGLDPSVFPTLPGSTPPQVMQDRVEVVRFPNPGRFLVLCGVLAHFFDAATGQFIMFGYVKVHR